MDDDWVVLRDGGGNSSGSDTASDDGSDSGFAIVRSRRRGNDGGDRRAGLGSPAVLSFAPASPPRAAVPQPTPPGLFIRVISYGDAFSPPAPALTSSTAAVPAAPVATPPATSFSAAARVSHDVAALPELCTSGSDDAFDLSELLDALDEEQTRDYATQQELAKALSAAAVLAAPVATRPNPSFSPAATISHDEVGAAGECGPISDAAAAEMDNGVRHDFESLLNDDYHRRVGYDDIDEGSDAEESENGYIDMVPSPGRGGAKTPVRSYDDIDTSDEEGGGYSDVADGGSEVCSCDGGELSATASGAVDTAGLVSRKYDDIDESDYDEEDEGCGSSEVEDCSGTEEGSSDEDDGTCSSDGEESSDEEEDGTSSSDGEESSGDGDDYSCSSGGEVSSCSSDDGTCGSDEEESSGDEDDEDSDNDSSDEAEESDCDEEEDSSGTEESNSDEDDGTENSDSDEEDVGDGSIVEEAGRTQKHNMDTPDAKKSRCDGGIDVTSPAKQNDCNCNGGGDIGVSTMEEAKCNVDDMDTTKDRAESDSKEDDMDTSDTTGRESSAAEDSDSDEEDDTDGGSEIDSCDVEEDRNEDLDTPCGCCGACVAYNAWKRKGANEISGLGISDDEESDSDGDKVYVYNPKPVKSGAEEEHVEPVGGKYDDIDTDVEDDVGEVVDGRNAELDGVASNVVEESPTGPAAAEEMEKHQDQEEVAARETFDRAKLARAPAAVLDAFEATLRGSCAAEVRATPAHVQRRSSQGQGSRETDSMLHDDVLFFTLVFVLFFIVLTV